MSQFVPDPAQTEWVPIWDTGAVGSAQKGSIPGEIKMWSGSALPNALKYGKWVWADGAIYDEVTYPEAAANIDVAWKTAYGLGNPGAGKFRAPDMRGVTPMGMDAMPGGTRANRTTRSVAIVIAGQGGEEYHTIALAEMPAHAHTVASHYHGGSTGYVSVDHTHVQQGNTLYNDQPGYAFTTTNQTGMAGTVGRATGGISANHYHAITAEAPGTNNAGSGGAHENLPPAIFVPWIVRLDG
jgi:microcystin-dependent protein